MLSLFIKKIKMCENHRFMKEAISTDLESNAQHRAADSLTVLQTGPAFKGFKKIFSNCVTSPTFHL
jgi:hypothetical protein